jgi:hypothetical protein
MLTAKKTMAAVLAGAMTLSSTVAIAQTAAPVATAPLRVGAPVKKAEKISGRTLAIVLLIGGSIGTAIALGGKKKSVSP